MCVSNSIKHQLPNQKLKGWEILSPYSTTAHTWLSPELTGAEESTTGSSKESREEHTRRKASPKDWWRVKGWEQVRRSRSHDSLEAGARKSSPGKENEGDRKCMNGMEKGQYRGAERTATIYTPTERIIKVISNWPLSPWCSGFGSAKQASRGPLRHHHSSLSQVHTIPAGVHPHSTLLQGLYQCLILIGSICSVTCSLD